MDEFENWTWHFADSKLVLRHWFDGEIDILYVDGLHHAHHVLQDFILAFPFLKIGSLVIFDDFGIGRRKNFPHVPEAIASILLSFEGLVMPLCGNHLQYAIEVVRKDVNFAWHDKTRATSLIKEMTGAE